MNRLKRINLLKSLQILISFLLFFQIFYVVATANEKDILLKRAQAYWNAIVAGDKIESYKFEVTSKKGEEPLSAYVKKGSLIYRNAKVEKVIINKDKAIVKVKINYSIPALSISKVLTTTIDDTWIKIDGVWYHKRDSLLKNL